MRFISLFAGIGGMDLGLERAGMTCVAQVEKDEWARRVLAKHWPDVPRFGDIYDVNGTDLPAADLIAGGFPCQPFSVAGKQQGTRDDRHLWPEYLRLINDIRPRWVLGENVPGIINLALDGVLSDLENAGYTCRAFIIPAVSVDAPHRRDRVWIVGHTERGRRKGQPRGRADAQPENGHLQLEERIMAHAGGADGRQKRGFRPQQFGGGRPSRWLPEPGVGRVANGIPRRVDRLRGLGNAVVPQVVEVLGRMILEADRAANI